MAEYVVFALVAPMGSFGGLAGHERRGSDSWPGRSAILGLLGAALGVRREDPDGQEALRTWKTAVSVLSEGQTLRDFHTVQTVPSANIKRPATRAYALKKLKASDNAVITWRDYRTDCAFGVAVWGGDHASLVAALQTPHFVPYLGRKSCPLSAPMAPKTVLADSVHEALLQTTLPPFPMPFPQSSKPLRVISDEPARDVIEEVCWDEPLDREKWHFGKRSVYVSAVEAGS